MELIEYTNDELFELIVETISHGKRKYHSHYAKTIERAKFYNQIMTGDDQRELLIQFKRENKVQEDQRLKVTNSRTQYASGKIYSVYNEVARSDNFVEVIKYTQESEQNRKKLEEINDRLKKFYGDMDAKQYTYEAIKRLNFYDPNAFLITNFTEFDAKKEKTAFVYPIEVYSEQAIRYEYSNGVLVYLMFYQWGEIDDLDSENKPVRRKVKNYYLFAKDVSFEFMELPERMQVEMMPGFQQIDINILNPDGEKEGSKERDKTVRSFQWKQYDTKSKRIPAVRVGYLYDAGERNAICVSPLQAAEKLFYDLIWTKSEYDLAKALHWFYQKFIYAPKCGYEDPDDPQNFCNHGKMSVGGETCRECDGSGLMLHTTVQDVIVLQLPSTAEEVVPLSNMVHYENIDISIGQHLQEDFKGIEKDIFKAVFNSQAFDKSEISVTATEKNLDMRAVKNALIDFGDQVSRVYKFIIQMTAIYLDNDKELIVQHKHGRDFKFDSIDELVLQRDQAVKAGAPYSIIRNIDLAILELQNQDNPETVELLRQRERFRPFREKTESERMFILSSMRADDAKRILWVYFEDIMTEIAFEDKDREKPWHHLSYPDQKDIIDEKVEAIRTDVLEEQQAAQARLPFGAPSLDIDEDEEEEDDENDETQ